MLWYLVILHNYNENKTGNKKNISFLFFQWLENVMCPFHFSNSMMRTSPVLMFFTNVRDKGGLYSTAPGCITPTTDIAEATTTAAAVA